MSFKVGDKAVHPSHGVGEVTGIETLEIAGFRTEFYIVQIQKAGMIVKIPVGGVDKIGFRRVISRAKADAVYDELKKEEITVTSQPWNRRQREYNELLNSGSPISVAKVVRDLYRLRFTKELSHSEKNLLKEAKIRLVPELALARRVKEETIERDLENIFEDPNAGAEEEAEK